MFILFLFMTTLILCSSAAMAAPLTQVYRGVYAQAGVDVENDHLVCIMQDGRSYKLVIKEMPSGAEYTSSFDAVPLKILLKGNKVYVLVKDGYAFLLMSYDWKSNLWKNIIKTDHVFRDFVVDNRTIYYAVRDDRDKIYRLNIDNSQQSLLISTDCQVGTILSAQNSVYYTKKGENGQWYLEKISAHGVERVYHAGNNAIDRIKLFNNKVFFRVRNPDYKIWYCYDNSGILQEVGHFEEYYAWLNSRLEMVREANNWMKIVVKSGTTAKQVDLHTYITGLWGYCNKALILYRDGDVYACGILIMPARNSITMQKSDLVLYSNMQIINGVGYVRLSEIMQAMGYNVQWDGVNRQIVCRRGQEVLYFSLKNNTVLYAGKYKKLSSPLVTLQGKAYMPVRQIMEMLGIGLKWLSDEQRLVIDL